MKRMDRLHRTATHVAAVRAVHKLVNMVDDLVLVVLV